MILNHWKTARLLTAADPILEDELNNMDSSVGAWPRPFFCKPLRC